MRSVRFVYRLRFAGFIVALLMAFCLLGPRQVHGQQWLQTAKVLTPVEDGPVRTFLDTLVHRIEDNDRQIRRAPDRDMQISVEELRSILIEEHGMGVASANRLVIGYRFEIDFGSRLERDITSLHFQFRPGPAQTDVPVLYLDAQQEWVQEILRERGTDLPTNEAALIPFRRHLEFVNLARQDDTELIEIADETVRKGFEVKKEALIRKIERLMYDQIV